MLLRSPEDSDLKPSTVDESPRPTSDQVVIPEPSAGSGDSVAAHSLRLGRTRYPVVLPTIRDPRLHLAAVILSIHVLGQFAFGFRVSIAQILVALLVAAVVEVVWTFAQARALVWPASALLTGSAVALIFRVLGTENGDYWSMRGWYLFAIVAAAAVATKYVIRFRGTHVFNPANVALVGAFVVLGSTRVEPLDFWWGPLDGWMVLAYAIILTGGLLITRRLHLLSMSVAFWVTLTVSIGVLAASGHCMIARWSFVPVCGTHFWWIIVTSPEILIFMFFMITDPKTVPGGRVARMVFGASIAVVSTLLIAPQTTEFGAKVGLLAGLVVLCVARLPLRRLLPASDSELDELGPFVGQLAVDDGRVVAPRRAVGRGAILGALVVFLATAIVAAGAPAREAFDRASSSPEPTVEIDPASLPPVTVAPEVVTAIPELAGDGATQVAVELAEDLEIETRALLGVDEETLFGADAGARLTEMQGRIDEALASGEVTVTHYAFDSLRLSGLVSAAGQSSLSLGVDARGTVERITFDGAGNETDRSTAPFATTFVLSQPTGTRWLIVQARPLG
jgi:hypothetical protein